MWRGLELLEMLESMAYSVFIAASLGKVNLVPPQEIDNLENTMKTRKLPMPGLPGRVRRLRDAFLSSEG